MKTAVILAGGKGTRLKPYTVVLPKPLMPLGDYPILEIIVRQLAYYGFDRIIMAVNHQADIIKAFFGNGERWGVTIEYSLENIPLSTMGPLKLIDELPEDFLIMNGDVICDLNFEDFYQFHIKKKSIFTISSCEREVKSEFGVLEVDSMGNLNGFKEKPICKYNVSMGIYMANTKVLEFIPENQAYGFDTLMLDLINKNTKASVRTFNGYWLDIGKPDDYLQAVNEFDDLKHKFLK